MSGMVSDQANNEKVLLLRTCEAGGKSFGGFVWPLQVGATVRAPDWDPEPTCGNGLHGLLWGCGDATLLNHDAPNWLVVEADADRVVDLGGKVKAPEVVVRFVGARDAAIAYLLEHGAAGRPVVFATASAGHSGTARAGDRGTASAGYRGTASAGDWGTASAGDWGTASAGHRGTASAGYGGTASAGDWGTARAGHWGTASAGHWGTASAGHWGTASAGHWGTASAGHWGTASAGDGGTAAAGEWGIISVKWFDGRRYRVAMGYVGEDGIEPGVPYWVENGRLVQAGEVSP